MDTAVGILAAGEIALLGRVLAEIIERHGADLAQFTQEEVSQRRQLRRAGLGAALLGLRCGRHRRRTAIDLTLGLGQRRAPIRFGCRRWTALLDGLRCWTVLVFSLGRRPAMGLTIWGRAMRMLGLRLRTAFVLDLRSWVAIRLRLGRYGLMITVSLSRRTTLLLRLWGAMTGMLNLGSGTALIATLGILCRRGAGQPPQFDLDECVDGFELFLQMSDASLVLAC